MKTGGELMTLSFAFSLVLKGSLTASLVIAAVLLLRLLLRRAPRVFSYALWAVVLFRLLCPVGIEAPVGVPGYDVLQQAPALADQTIPLPEAAGDSVDFPQAGAAGEAQPGISRAQHWLSLGAGIWLAGIGLLFLSAAFQLLALRRRLTGAVQLEDKVFLADHIATPFLFGLFRPRIYLPSALPEDAREYILLHERCHLRRLDHVTRFLAFLALGLHWFNPLVWLAFSLSGRDMEMACDEAVLNKLGRDIRAAYSGSLLRLATGRKLLPGMPLAFGEGDTKRRVKNVMNYRRASLLAVTAAAVLCAVALLGLSLDLSRENGVMPSPASVPTVNTPSPGEAKWAEALAPYLPLGISYCYDESSAIGRMYYGGREVCSLVDDTRGICIQQLWKELPAQYSEDAIGQLHAVYKDGRLDSLSENEDPPRARTLQTGSGPAWEITSSVPVTTWEEYAAFGLIRDVETGDTYYNGQLVRYFFDRQLSNTEVIHDQSFFDPEGTIDVYAVRAPLEGTHPVYSGGELLAVGVFSQEEFDNLEFDPAMPFPSPERP